MKRNLLVALAAVDTRRPPVLRVIPAAGLVATVSVVLAGASGSGAREAAAVTASSNQRPPPIVLTSKAGSQRAVLGSYCVAVPLDDDTSVIGCADSLDPEPRRLSVVRPKEQVTIRIRGAKKAKGSLSIHPRGCEARTVKRFKINSPRKRWKVRLRPGKYELDIFLREFATTDGRVGDTSGVLGLLVARNRAPDVIPSHGSLGCSR